MGPPKRQSAQRPVPTVRPSSVEFQSLPDSQRFFSSLDFLGASSNGKYRFVGAEGGSAAGSPKIAQFTLDSKKKQFEIQESHEFSRGDGVPILASSYHPSASQGFASDFQGVVRTPGRLWFLDQLNSAIVETTESGKWLNRYLPKGVGGPGVQVLPGRYREVGFGGMAYSDGKIALSVRETLAPPTALSERALGRVLKFDVFSRRVVGEFLFVRSDKNSVIHGATALGRDRWLILENDQVYRLTLRNLPSLKETLGSTDPLYWEKLGYPGVERRGVRIAKKESVFDLKEMGEQGPSKVSGFSLVGFDKLAIIGHNRTESNPGLWIVQLPGRTLAGSEPLSVPWMKDQWTKLPTIKLIPSPPPTLSSGL